MTKLRTAIVALAMMTTAAHSQTTIDHWIASCSKGASTPEMASCRSYARGVADVIMLTQVAGICIPAGITENDLINLALPYVQGQPPTSPPHVAATMLMSAFRAAFPCRTR